MPETVDVLIVGAGFSGICMAIQLQLAGIRSFLVLEKGEQIGGTWWYNRYPGCACDVPSHLYSFSFDRNPEWSRMFAGQAEILDYLRGCARRWNVESKVRLRMPVREAGWDEQKGVWHVVAGEGVAIDARVMVFGMGPLHVPRFPELDGMERFRGPSFHSAEWDSAVSLEGKTVAVIGTGASSAQFVPHLASQVHRLHVFQRTPAWILPRLDHPISEGWRSFFRNVPGATWLMRMLIFWRLEVYVYGFLGNRLLRGIGRKQARRNLEEQIADPELRRKLTPGYEFGCKRILISSDFYPALTRSNVELVTEAISEVREHSIVTADGVERPVDALIYGTGFHPTGPLRHLRVTGRGGISIQDAWTQRASAFLGIAVSGFPNLFLLLGPNTGLGHNSVLLMIEAQVRYVVACLRLMERRGQRVMEVRAGAQHAFVEEMRSRLPGTVWEAGGCRSWYQDEHSGESFAIWPDSVGAYRMRTRVASPGDYRFGHGSAMNGTPG